jgi:hypothetical protein
MDEACGSNGKVEVNHMPPLERCCLVQCMVLGSWIDGAALFEKKWGGFQ